MQNEIKSSNSELTSSSYFNDQQINFQSQSQNLAKKNTKKISLVLIRIELDDLYIEELDNQHTNFINNFKYYSPYHLSKQKTTLTQAKPETLKEISDKLNLKQEEAIKLFIGKRESNQIIVETYSVNNISKYINMSNKNHNDNKTTLNNLNQHFVTSAMTMQTALETAYNDWNKQKSSNSNSDSNESKIESQTSHQDIKSELNELTLTTLIIDDNHAKLHKTQELELKLEDTSEIPFYYGNPTVDIVKGFLHIYKDSKLISLEDIENHKKENTSDLNVNQEQLRSEMLCMIGIPASIGCNELLEFIMPNDSIDYVKIIRDMCPNQYMALIKFKKQSDADAFYVEKNNKFFNSIEENVCHLVYVERIEAMNSSKGASIAIPDFTELPPCYICLERMDESLNGVITILCNHSFHANCLSKWGDTCCPVCRYSQTPDYTLDNHCTECGSHENLWICLICGNIGCGRYVRGHAYDHFKLTQHTYSMQLGSNRVWDYTADNYVHRLIQNKTDGKLVQFDESGRVINQDEKIDSITMEYTFLLTSQLESQRLFFEDRIAKIEDKAKLQISDIEAKCKEYETENEKLKETVGQLTKERNTLDKKCTTLNTKVNKMQSELDEEKELNKCLSSNQDAYQKKLNQLEDNLKKSNIEKDNEIKELQSQLKDVMFYLDAQSKMSQLNEVSQEEIQEGQIVIQQDEASGTSLKPSAAKAASRRRKK